MITREKSRCFVYDSKTQRQNAKKVNEKFSKSTKFCKLIVQIIFVLFSDNYGIVLENFVTGNRLAYALLIMKMLWIIFLSITDAILLLTEVVSFSYCTTTLSACSDTIVRQFSSQIKFVILHYPLEHILFPKLKL